jgi:hypothetical protein
MVKWTKGRKEPLCLFLQIFQKDLKNRQVKNFYSFFDIAKDTCGELRTQNLFSKKN